MGVAPASKKSVSTSENPAENKRLRNPPQDWTIVPGCPGKSVIHLDMLGARRSSARTAMKIDIAHGSEKARCN
jgi:hypothetical protein